MPVGCRDGEPTVRGQPRRWSSYAGIAFGLLLTAAGCLFVLVLVSGVLSGDQDVKDAIPGFVVFIAVSLIPGVYLLARNVPRDGRTRGGDPMTRDEPYTGYREDLLATRRARRLNRRAWWVTVTFGTLGVFGVVFAQFGRDLDQQPGTLAGGIVAATSAVIIGLTLWRLRARPSLAPIVGADERIRFRNIAFSTQPPNRRGWNHQVGVVCVLPDRVEMYGPRDMVTVHAPLSAASRRENYSHWEMILITGHTATGAAVTVYLVVRGRPTTKWSASATDMGKLSHELVERINDTVGP